jgi:hypothetical protein
MIMLSVWTIILALNHLTQEYTDVWVAVVKLLQSKAVNCRLKIIISIVPHKDISDGE